jgi:hypothetical protein
VFRLNAFPFEITGDIYEKLWQYSELLSIHVSKFRN